MQKTPTRAGVLNFRVKLSLETTLGMVINQLGQGIHLPTLGIGCGKILKRY